jgi:phosphohistidine phosphatase SixA
VAGLAAGAATHLNFNLPTAAIAHLELEIFWWNQIRWGSGQLILLLPPKLLRKVQES